MVFSKLLSGKFEICFSKVDSTRKVQDCSRPQALWSVVCQRREKVHSHSCGNTPQLLRAIATESAAWNAIKTESEIKILWIAIKREINHVIFFLSQEELN